MAADKPDTGSHGGADYPAARPQSENPQSRSAAAAAREQERQRELEAIKQEAIRAALERAQQARAVYQRQQRDQAAAKKKSHEAADTNAAKPLPLAEKREAVARSRRRARWRLIGIIAGILALLAGIGAILLYSPLLAFQPSETKVSGANATVPVAAVTQVTEQYGQKSLLLIRPSSVSKELEAQLPWLEKATVSRDFPHGLEITLTMRKAVAQLPGKDGYLDASGKLLPVVAGAPQGLIPVIGAKTQQQREAAATVASVLAGPLRKQVESINVTNPDSIVVQLSGDRTLKWGAVEESDIKARVATVLLTIEARNYSVIDPRHPLSSPK